VGQMKPIYMSNSIFPTFVDDEDFPLLNRYTWRIDTKGYVVTGLCGTTVRLHRFILNPPKNIQIDHINGDKLNNTKTNLRFATNTENQRNVPKRKTVNKKPTTSKYKGVHWKKEARKWIARIAVNKERIHLGQFNSEEEAAKAYNKAASIHFGEFAKLNQIEGE
jgi:hypothetical protein